MTLDMWFSYLLAYTVLSVLPGPSGRRVLSGRQRVDGDNALSLISSDCLSTRAD
jgi:hypothetical protein